MTDKERIERIAKLLNELSLDDITSIEFDEMFPKQSINDIKDELWRMYCFASDVCDTINMGDTAEESKTEWIPVSEGLPDIHNCCMKYLVTDCHEHIHTSLFTESGGKSWWSHEDVIAWIPLPEPYKEG